MFLNEVHTQLCAGELSKLFEGEGAELAPESLPKINALIQAGINDMNTRFAVREKEILIKTTLEQRVYELVPSNAVSSGNVDGFILDSVQEPFQGDISQILRVTDSTGQSLGLNTDTALLMPVDNVFGTRPSIFTHTGINLTAYNTLKLHHGNDLGELIVHYKARLKPLDFSADPAAVYIDLPDHMLNALVLYVASRKYNPKGAETIGRGMFHEGNNYWTKYLDEINNLKVNFASIGSQGETTNFQRGGWV